MGHLHQVCFDPRVWSTGLKRLRIELYKPDCLMGCFLLQLNAKDSIFIGAREVFS